MNAKHQFAGSTILPRRGNSFPVDRSATSALAAAASLRVPRRFFAQFGPVAALVAALTVPVAPAVAQSAGKSRTGPAAGSSTSPLKPQDAQAVNMTDYGAVDLAVQDTELAKVLEMLSIHSQKNIIVSKNVSATVTAYLYDVTLTEALDAILRPNGYGYIEQGNFIYIYTLEELAEIEKTNRKTEARIFELDHLSAVDAKAFLTPLLSNDGKAEFRGEVSKGFEPKIADGGADDYAFNTKIVVNDYPEQLERIAALLNELDTPPSQVLVESTILQTTVDEKNAFGVDFSVIGSVNFTDLTNPLSGVINLLNGSDPTLGFVPQDNDAVAATSTVGNVQGPGGLKVGFISDDISVFLRVLDEVTDTNVLARPKIMALNRQRAQVLVGAKVGYLSTTATETSTTQSVEFLDTGIKLVFRPFISKDGTIRMELAPSVSEASLRTVTDAGGLQVTIPDQLTNELATNVRLRDGQTVVLGGLFKESTRINRRQIPFVGDVPILGIPFRGQDDTVRKDEIIFLITPTIVRDEIMAKAGADAMAYTESARVGMRIGLLPWSRELVTNNHNQRAVEALARGEGRLALWHADTSLRLNPSQPEIVRFRETAGAASQTAHERSVLERVWHPIIDVDSKAAANSASSSRIAVAQASTTSGDSGAAGAASTPTTTTDSMDGTAAGPATDTGTPVAAIVEVMDPNTGATTPTTTHEPATEPSSGPSPEPTGEPTAEPMSATTISEQPLSLSTAGVSANQPASISSPAPAPTAPVATISSTQALALDQLMAHLFLPWRLSHGMAPTDPTVIDPACITPSGASPMELATVLTEPDESK